MLIPAIAQRAFNPGMSVKETRRANLVALIARYPSAEAMSAAIGTDPTYVRNIRNGVRNLGDKLARQIEERLGLAPGAMDLPFVEDTDALPPSALLSLLLTSYPGLSRDDADRVLALAETLAKRTPPRTMPLQQPASRPAKKGARR